ncbi:hypothetical protein GTY41_02460 [Streptomyces sp. SID685]|uniref:hypothetical protein n=1 Tax=Streptomyces sp. SID685 TaxID=2690322 RepID=UPI001371C1E5|nr:hypothetical protein [Streptomyces sp. SID685]MYR83837.1 hypothetical protein [Streptomyces sp. SID685]
MYLTRTFGHWQIELHRRAIYLTRLPKADPNCTACKGDGGHGYVTEDGCGDWIDCHCLTWLRTWRLPFWPRRTIREEYPF